MPSIDGRLEWDDDALSPGKKKEGGLHSTLFDDGGNLKSSARFIPDENGGAREPTTVVEHIYVEVPAAPNKTPEQLALEAAVSEQLCRLIDYGIEKLSPHAVRFWEQKAQPSLKATLTKVKAKSKRKRAGAKSEAAKVSVDSVSQQGDFEMSEDEARRRYMLAVAARAFSDEQMRALAAANVTGENAYADLQQAADQLPASEAAALIAALASPSLLGEDVLAELRRPINHAAVREREAIEAWAETADGYRTDPRLRLPPTQRAGHPTPGTAI